MPIINPLDTETMDAIYAYNALMGIDKNSEKYIERFADFEANNNISNNKLSLYDSVCKGLKNDIEKLTLKELEVNLPLDIVNNILIKALNEVGSLYDKGKLFLPQLISSAEAAKISFDTLTKKFPKSNENKGTIILATVKGDVHDIGKNICKIVLESYGYTIIDLGKDTEPRAIVDAYNKYKPSLVGLSALMTTTVVSMENTIKMLKENDINCRVVVGGAVLTEAIANEIKADYYAADALAFVRLAQEIIK